MTDLQRKRCLAKGEVPEGYRNTPIGILPSDWGYAKLGDLSVELTETAGQKTYETVSISAGIGFVNQAEKFGKELSGKQYAKYIVLHKGDFSYNKGNSSRFPWGCIYRLNDREEAAVPNVFESFRIVKGCPEYYEQLFASGYLNHQLDRLINHGVRDDGLLNLTGKDFYSCFLPVPPVQEQKRIAEILSACGRTIDSYRQKAEQYQALKKALMEKMFPKKGCSIPEVRFPGFTKPWEQRKLGVIADIKTGPFGTQLSAKEYTSSGIPVINVKNIGAGRVLETDLDYVSENTARRLCDHIIRENDIVFGRKGAIGRHAIISKTQENWVQGSDCIRVRFKPGIVASYVNTQLQTGNVIDYLSINAYGSTMLTLTTDMIAFVPLLMPEEAEQTRIARIFSNIDHLITLHQRGADVWRTKKKALQQLLLKGFARV